MSITVVTRYSGDIEIMLKAAKINGPLFLKYGATSVRVMRITTGPNYGHHLAAMTYDSYAAMEACQAKLAKDPAYKKAVAMLQKASVAHERNILADVPF